MENSQTTSRPPGRVTRRISARAAAVSSTLRSPKEMVTASKLPSAYGSRRASPATKLSAGRRRLPTAQHAERQVGGHDRRPGRARTARSRSRCRRRGRGPARRAGGRPPATHQPAPGPVLAERQHVVGQVVARGDPVEHRRHLAPPLLERGAEVVDGGYNICGKIVALGVGVSADLLGVIARDAHEGLWLVRQSGVLARKQSTRRAV